MQLFFKRNRIFLDLRFHSRHFFCRNAQKAPRYQLISRIVWWNSGNNV